MKEPTQAEIRAAIDSAKAKYGNVPSAELLALINDGVQQWTDLKGEVMQQLIGRPDVDYRALAEAFQKSTPNYCEHGRPWVSSCMACEGDQHWSVRVDDEDPIPDTLREERPMIKQSFLSSLVGTPMSEVEAKIIAAGHQVFMVPSNCGAVSLAAHPNTVVIWPKTTTTGEVVMTAYAGDQFDLDDDVSEDPST